MTKLALLSLQKNLLLQSLFKRMQKVFIHREKMNNKNLLLLNQKVDLLLVREMISQK